MKSFYVCLALFGVCLILFLALSRPNFLDHTELNTPEALSSWLSYKIEFHPAQDTKEASFTATLTNVSSYYLGLVLNDKKFEGLVMVKHDNERNYKFMDRDFLNLLQTGLWNEPKTYLAPSKSVIWTVPLSTLVDLNGKPVTKELLSGRTVYGHISITILPMQMLARNYAGDNASQESAPIQIPLLGKSARSAAPYRPGQERFLDWCLRATSYP